LKLHQGEWYVKMKNYIAIISDDITGANDSGVQLLESGINTTVLFDIPNKKAKNKNEHIVINTNSRMLTLTKAKRVTKQAGKYLLASGYEIIYKKMDSTLRGYPGTELKVLQQLFNADFVFIAPAYPTMGRTTMNGIHYVNGKRIAKTEFSKDPQHPITESSIVKMIKTEIDEDVGLLTKKDFQDRTTFKSKITLFKRNKIKYIVCDSEKQKDLQKLAHYISSLHAKVIWAGSAGLAQELPNVYKSCKKRKGVLQITANRTLTVCGSLSDISKKQVKYAIQQPNIIGIQLDTARIFNNKWQDYKHQILNEVLKHVSKGNDTVLYLPSDQQIRDKVEQIQRKLNLSSYETGKIISRALGNIVTSLVSESNSINGFVLTGGDTAKDIFHSLNGESLQLIREIEPGIPLGILNCNNTKYPVVTKAGAFGNEKSIFNAIRALKGAVQ